jgi:hypothetical protein
MYPAGRLHRFFPLPVRRHQTPVPQVFVRTDQTGCQAANKLHQKPGFQAFQGHARPIRGLARYLLLPH